MPLITSTSRLTTIGLDYGVGFSRLALCPGCGRVHIITTQPGIGGPLFRNASARYADGVLPTSRLNSELNEPTLSKPTMKQTSVTLRLAPRRRLFARSTRLRVR